MSEDNVQPFSKIWFSKYLSWEGTSNVAENAREKWKKEGKPELTNMTPSKP